MRPSAVLRFFLSLLLAVASGRAAADPEKVSWDLSVLSQPPKVYPAPESDKPGIRALFFDGLPWKGKPTRVFAFLGLPKHKPGEKVPGMVLVHGGGGTAYADWVKLWNDRGYAAIALDISGSMPDRQTGKPVVHDHAGPEGYGGYDQIDWPVEDQWTYQAAGAVVLANSLLRAQPEVDPDRIGISGISWGAYLTCIVTGVDPRYQFAVAVYGCGFLENTALTSALTIVSPEQAQKWYRLWEPSHYLANAKMPFLWVDGTNDRYFPLDALQKSYRLPPGPRTLSTRVRMLHGHEEGWLPKEIGAYADSLVKNGTPLAQIIGQKLDGNRASVEFKSKSPITRAELNFTKDSGFNWSDRTWETEPATVIGRTKARAVLPKGATAFYFNLIDENNLIVSSEHVSLEDHASP